MADTTLNDMPLASPAKRRHSPSASPVADEALPSAQPNPYKRLRLQPTDPDTLLLQHSLAPWAQSVPLASFRIRHNEDGPTRYQYDFARFQSWLEETRPLFRAAQPLLMKVILRNGNERPYHLALLNHWSLHNLACLLRDGRAAVPSLGILGPYLELVPVEDGEDVPQPIEADIPQYSADQLDVSAISLYDDDLLEPAEAGSEQDAPAQQDDCPPQPAEAGSEQDAPAQQDVSSPSAHDDQHEHGLVLPSSSPSHAHRHKDAYDQTLSSGAESTH